MPPKRRHIRTSAWFKNIFVWTGGYTDAFVQAQISRPVHSLWAHERLPQPGSQVHLPETVSQIPLPLQFLGHSAVEQLSPAELMWMCVCMCVCVCLYEYRYMFICCFITKNRWPKKKERETSCRPYRDCLIWRDIEWQNKLLCIYTYIYVPFHPGSQEQTPPRTQTPCSQPPTSEQSFIMLQFAPFHLNLR